MTRMLGFMVVLGAITLAVAGMARTEGGTLVTFFSGKCLEHSAFSKDCPKKHALR